MKTRVYYLDKKTLSGHLFREPEIQGESPGTEKRQKWLSASKIHSPPKAERRAGSQWRKNFSCFSGAAFGGKGRNEKMFPYFVITIL
ncbi:hypothetical protein NDU88_004241 [Pleurodeles waltl]|uniref:Uncharacterized protein n=1 Tax=Pleurodeles waltl TaxID=8319 RepID=A0AAV7WV32_PLEWA|nr:hypothetical protein NDU88_004241 [Pleurodeles waltl]